MTTDVSPPVPTTTRFPLTLLVVLAAVFNAVRPALESAATTTFCQRVAELLLAGELAAARLLLADYAAPPPGPEYRGAPLAYQLAARAVLAGLDAVATLGPETPPRTFHARVALLGHTDLGLCLVEEARLAGAEALRCTQLCASPHVVHWVRAQSLYQLTEVSAEEAVAVVHAWHREHEEEERQRAEAIARQRARRGECNVTVQRRGQFVYVVATHTSGKLEPGALLDVPVQDAMQAAGFDGQRHYDGGRWLGSFDGYLSRDDAEQAATLGSPLCEALAGPAAGFLTVTVLPAVDANDGDEHGDDAPEAF